jgi:hypothetical protein
MVMQAEHPGQHEAVNDVPQIQRYHFMDSTVRLSQNKTNFLGVQNNKDSFPSKDLDQGQHAQNNQLLLSNVNLADHQFHHNDVHLTDLNHVNVGSQPEYYRKNGNAEDDRHLQPGTLHLAQNDLFDSAPTGRLNNSSNGYVKHTYQSVTSDKNDLLSIKNILQPYPFNKPIKDINTSLFEDKHATVLGQSRPYQSAYQLQPQIQVNSGERYHPFDKAVAYHQQEAPVAVQSLQTGNFATLGQLQRTPADDRNNYFSSGLPVDQGGVPFNEDLAIGHVQQKDDDNKPVQASYDKNFSFGQYQKASDHYADGPEIPPENGLPVSHHKYVQQNIQEYQLLSSELAPSSYDPVQSFGVTSPKLKEMDEHETHFSSQSFPPISMNSQLTTKDETKSVNHEQLNSDNPGLEDKNQLAENGKYGQVSLSSDLLAGQDQQHKNTQIIITLHNSPKIQVR